MRLQDWRHWTRNRKPLTRLVMVAMLVSMSIAVRPGTALAAPASMLVVASPDTVVADGTSSSTVTATLSSAGLPCAGVEVTFSTGLGAISGTNPVLTNASGQATITLTSSTTGSATVTASSTLAFASTTVDFVLPPTVTGISPNSGPAAGGNSVTITGTNLDVVTSVYFGDFEATVFTVVSPTQITVTAPAGSGTVYVLVISLGGSSESVDAAKYTYSATVATPTATPGDGSTVANNATVTLSCVTPGATIYYTTDGTDPTTDSSSGTSVTVGGVSGATVTVKALAVAPGMTDSTTATFTYTVRKPTLLPRVETPTATPGGGSTVAIGGTVTLATATPWATIYYTLDGGVPTISGQAGTSVTLDGVPGQTVIITALAVASDMRSSLTATFTYTLQPPLKDIAGNWAQADIEKLFTLGVVTSDSDGRFRPDEKITRAEFVTMLVRTLRLAPVAGPVFPDTVGHWAQEYISTAAACGIVKGYDADHFGPNDPVTREQITAMVVRAAGLAHEPATLSFTDSNLIDQWARGDVETAVLNGIIEGYPDGTLRPLSHGTRAEAATIIAKILK